WNRFAARTPRPLSSIILPSPIKDALMADIHSFLKSEEWYKNLGIPYRRGYMLHGPPGTGKSSFIFAVAGALKMNLCLVNLSMPGLTDADLSNLLSSSPKNSILVFEDVDVSMGKHVKGPRGSTAGKEDEGDDGDKKDKSSLDENETKSQVTLSGLLNSLDGIVAQEGRIVFLTTNNLASLPAALLRPGRVDRRFLFPTADADVAARLFQRFYGMDLGEEKALTLGFKIAEKLGVGKDGNGLGVAQLQGLYLRYREEPSSVLDHTDEFLAELEQDAKD
ncbi:P-loop containing nucleoside triphosphate hydrolase protein, partial [Chytriomyces sp. MP71]